MIRSGLTSLLTPSTDPWVFSSVPALGLLLDQTASFQAQSGHKPPQPPPSLHFDSRTVSVMHGLLASGYSLHIHVGSFCSHHILLMCGWPPRILEKTNRFFKIKAKLLATMKQQQPDLPSHLKQPKVRKKPLKTIVFKTLDIRQRRM